MKVIKYTLATIELILRIIGGICAAPFMMLMVIGLLSHAWIVEKVEGPRYG
jgi:hypothetical protein